MNNMQQQGRNDLQARVALAMTGNNLSPDISDAVRMRGATTVAGELASSATALNRAEQVSRESERLGLTVLTPESDHWPWVTKRLKTPEPLLLWAAGNLALLEEPLVQLADPSEPSGSTATRWALVESATDISDLGHVLLVTTNTASGRLALRAATALNGRWVAVSADITRDRAFLQLGAAGRGVVVSATPPRSESGLRVCDDSTEMLRRLAGTTITATAGGRRDDSGRGPIPRSVRLL